MADPTADGGVAYQVGAFAGAFIAAIIAWFAALKKKPETAPPSQSFADSDLRTQLLVSELKQAIGDDVEKARETLRLVLEAQRVGFENKLENVERDLHNRIGAISERLRLVEIDLARRVTRHRGD